MTNHKPPGERDEQQGQQKWYESTGYQVLFYTVGFILWVLVLLILLNWYFDPQTSTQKQSLVQTMAVFMAGAAFLFGFSFIARYLQVPHSGVIAVTFLVVVAVLWVLVQPETTNQRISFFQTVGGIVGGSALLFGLYFTAQTLQVNREGQITERFTRAIDQLGATDETMGKPKLEIRLGGIYALERIARDSPRRDYSTVMEVLTAYVRENSPQALGPSNEFPDAASPSNEATAEADVGTQQPAPPEPLRPTADIQAILDVLRRAQTRVPEEYRTRLDLHEANLQEANLFSANLQEANLREANLQGANLSGAGLLSANLQEANLRGANLRGANLQEANLYTANLQEANLLGANLQEASLLSANFLGANLQGANLLGADLGRANLQGANLQGAKVTDEQLGDALSLQGATMHDGSEHP